MTLSGMWIILIVSVLQLLVVVVIIAAIGKALKTLFTVPKGCTLCGSDEHNTNVCPWREHAEE